jgi:cytochrome c-type biogenesis protein CcmH/NrfG
MEFLKSIGLLFIGVLKRLYYLIPSLLSDPFDILERWGKMTYDPPQWLFWVLLAIGLFFAVAMTYNELRTQKRNLEKQVDDKAKKQEIRKALGVFLTEGNQLAIIDEKVEPPKQKVGDWLLRVANYLEENLGNDYKARFFDSSGLPMVFTRLSSLSRVGILSVLNTSNARIQIFLSELRD